MALGEPESQGGQRLSGSRRRLAVEDEVVHRVEGLARNQVSQEAPRQDRDGHTVTGVAAGKENVVCRTDGADRGRSVDRKAHVSNLSVRDRNVGEHREQLSEPTREPLVVRVSSPSTAAPPQ